MDEETRMAIMTEGEKMEKMGSIKVTESHMGRKMEAEMVKGEKKTRGMRQK